MNNDRTKKRSQFNAPIIPDELIAEILILLNVKTIVLFKCVSKSWNTLISDPIFIKNHLKKSSQIPRLMLTPLTSKYPISSVESFPVSRLLENSSYIVSGDNCHGSEDTCQVVGSCNGLLCLLFHSRYKKSFYVYKKYWFCLWNPATRTKSEKLGIFKDYVNIYLSKPYKFTFGCDISTETYKVVAISEKPILSKEGDEEDVVSWKCQVRIFSFGDNCWRKIQDCPLIPVCVMNILINRINNGVHLNGTINWLCLPDYLLPSYEHGWKSIANAQQFAIVSLDLSTETYKKLLLPRGFDEVPEYQPTLDVLKDCLCFSHDFKTTEFVVWQMKEFGVQESWTQLFRIDYFKIYHNLNFYGLTECGPPLLPLYLSTDGDTLILANSEDDRAIIYNWRDARVERIKISNKLCWFSTMDYVESLVSTCWK